MARPKRDECWLPLTVRLDARSASRLRIYAAIHNVPQGKVLDRLIMDHLPPVDPTPTSVSDAARPERVSVTSEWLRGEMRRLGISQAVLADALGITQKSVSEWFMRGAVPTARHDAIRAHLASVRQARTRANRGR